MFFIFSSLEVFNIPFIPGFLTICLDVGLFIICCVKHVLDSDKETRDFSSRNIMLYYFLEYRLPCVFSIFSLFGTLTIWMLNSLDRSCNFLMFLSYFQFIYPFVLLSESSPRVPNVVLFKTLFWSVNFHFQELCVILSLIDLLYTCYTQPDLRIQLVQNVTEPREFVLVCAKWASQRGLWQQDGYGSSRSIETSSRHAI